MGRTKTARSSSHRNCRNCGNDISHRDYRAKNCSEKCKNEYNYKNKNVSKSKRLMNHIRLEIESINLINFLLLKGQKPNSCAYCNEAFSSNELDTTKTRDHFIPKATLQGTKGFFKDAFYSLFTVSCCYRCNQLKQDMMPREFRDFIKNSNYIKRNKILKNLDPILNGI